jgi:hypothetical protein
VGANDDDGAGAGDVGGGSDGELLADSLQPTRDTISAASDPRHFELVIDRILQDQ